MKYTVTFFIALITAILVQFLTIINLEMLARDWVIYAPWLTVITTLLSPLIAVQVTRLLDKRAMTYKEKTDVFQTLFVYRSAQLSSLEFCTALSKTELLFCSGNQADKTIALNVEKVQGLLISPPKQDESDESKKFNEKRLQLITEAVNTLILAIANNLNIKINSRVVYSPSIWPQWVNDHQNAPRLNIQIQQDTLECFKYLTKNTPERANSGD